MGSYYDNGLSKRRVFYWKNNERIELPVPEGSYWCTDITVADGTVYTTGVNTQYDEELNQYINNGIMTKSTQHGTELFELPNGSFANAVIVANDTVYITGSYDEYTERACYWKGNERIDLPVPEGFSSCARAIAVENGIVYTLGSYYDSKLYDSNVICYWKNSERIDSASCNALAVVDGSVHIAGITIIGGPSGNEPVKKNV